MTMTSRNARRSLPFAFASTIGGAFNTMFTMRRDIRQLEQLDDRLLRDVGLTRADLDAMRYRR